MVAMCQNAPGATRGVTAGRFRGNLSLGLSMDYVQWLNAVGNMNPACYN